MDGVRIGTECDAQAWCEGVDVNFLVAVDDFTIRLVRFLRDGRSEYELYFPSGWTLTKTLLLPITFTTSPT